ncbi:hypothetical protein [Leifsonia sp. NCR5]|uniref:hypothetical protein n=1 Tax=Leifsonia sp. NCR5 TaxID=1978342 RepID=UPI0011799CB3|nr:hypothetical protein [Leifsonia sp. NCR5]
MAEDSGEHLRASADRNAMYRARCANVATLCGAAAGVLAAALFVQQGRLHAGVYLHAGVAGFCFLVLATVAFAAGSIYFAESADATDETKEQRDERLRAHADTVLNRIKVRLRAGKWLAGAAAVAVCVSLALAFSEVDQEQRVRIVGNGLDTARAACPLLDESTVLDAQSADLYGGNESVAVQLDSRRCRLGAESPTTTIFVSRSDLVIDR